MGDNQDGKVNFNYIFKAMEVEILPQPRAGTQSLYESFPPSSPPLCLLILTKRLSGNKAFIREEVISYTGQG